MPIYTVEIDGKTYDIEGDRPPSEAEARAAVGTAAEPPETTPAQDRAALFGGSSEPPIPPRPSLSEQMRDRPMWDRFVRPIPERLTDPDTGKDMPVLGGPGVLAFASTSGVSLPAAVKSVPGVIAKGLGISKARAGANIAEAVTAAKDVPIDVATSIGGPLKEIMGYKGIETVPMSVRSLSKAVESGQPLTVELARKYYPAISRMSANEFASLTPNMQRLVGGLRAAMNEGITASAETVGKGAQYAAGMKEYARAGKASKMAEEVSPLAKRVLRRLLEGGAAAVGAKSIWDALD